jgi:hypothetical protein
MPDLITHSGVTYLFGHFLGGKKITFLLLGSILPDMNKVLNFLFPGSNWFFLPLHTPVGLIVECYLFSLFFSEELREAAFKFTLSGSFLHLALDFFQRHLQGKGYLWFFPFSWQRIEIGLFWPEASLYWIPGILLAVIGVKITRVWKRRKVNLRG